MKCIRLEKEGFDICVTVGVKPIFMKKGRGDLRQEMERLDIARVLGYIGARQETTVAEEIVRAFRRREASS